MILEHRIYTVEQGKLGAFIEHYGSAIPRLYEKHGIKLLLFGQTIVGKSNEIVVVVGYDSLAHREQARASVEADPEFQQYLREGAGRVVHIENRFLRPSDFSPTR